MAGKKVTVKVPLKGTNVKKGINYAKGPDGRLIVVPDDNQAGPGRPPKYDAMEICERTIDIIRTLGADCSKTDVTAAFYDPKFNPNEPGQKERLLNVGDKHKESALARRIRKAKRKSQLVGYSQLLIEHDCPDFDELCAFARSESPPTAKLWIVARIAAKKKGKKNTRLYSLTGQQLKRAKKTKR